MDDDEQQEPWRRKDVPLSARKIELLRVYEQARFALTYQECLGRPAPNGIVGGPDWLRRTPVDETVLATLRAELIDVFNEDRPIDGWAHPDGSSPGDGDWQRLPDDPEKLALWIDERVRVQIGEMAAGIVRDILNGRRKEGTDE
jgi:hypothetical protein